MSKRILVLLIATIFVASLGCKARDNESAEVKESIKLTELNQIVFDDNGKATTMRDAIVGLLKDKHRSKDKIIGTITFRRNKTAGELWDDFQYVLTEWLDYDLYKAEYTLVKPEKTYKMKTMIYLNQQEPKERWDSIVTPVYINVKKMVFYRTDGSKALTEDNGFGPPLSIYKKD